MRNKLMVFLLSFALLVLFACSSSNKNTSQQDGGQDLAVQDTEAVDDTSGDISPDLQPDLQADAPEVADEVTEPEFPPRSLPFTFTRPMTGDPVPEVEVTVVTTEIMGMLADVGYFRWLLRTSTGVDASSGKEGYLAWHNDVLAVKDGSKVTFHQKGGEHNMWIAGSKVLSAAINGCALTADWETCKVAEQYCKGLTASVKGFVWGDDDPAPFLMARAIFPNDSDFVLDQDNWKDDGRKKAMTWDGAKKEELHWNAQTFAWPENPTWGSIWVTNMRSKDDVCAITRTTTFLPYIVADAPYEWVREACQETLDTMQGFNKDIVDSGYYIRTKDTQGKAYIIEDQDLGNYIWYTTIGDDNECTARLATDLIAYGEPLTNDCGSGLGSVFEMVAVETHYYNYPIVWDYHMAALGNALLYGHNDIALALLEGFAGRIDDYLDPQSKQPGASHGEWHRDMAEVLVKAASFGLPLTHDEARLVQKHWTQAVVEFSEWPTWDLWADSVEDGEYPASGGFRPSASHDGVRVESLALLMEYCNSPFKNPDGAQFVDCEVVSTFGIPEE
jgi:hypothetical protein